MEVDPPIVLKTLRETGDFLTKSSFLFLFHSGFPFVETWPLEKLEIVRETEESQSKGFPAASIGRFGG